MKHMIYDNFQMLEGSDAEKQLREIMSDNMNIPVEDITDEQVSLEKYVEYEQFFNDELVNLDKQLDGRIICIATLGLWNGTAQGYKLGGYNLNEILTMGNYDYISVWGDEYNIRKSSAHHDGTNYYLFREVHENRDIEKFCNMIYNGNGISNSQLNYYTKSLYDYVKNIYGW